MTIQLSLLWKLFMNTQSDAYQVTWLIRRLFRLMGQKANERLESLGINAADRAVMEFLYPDKHLSVPEIAEKYNVSRQHIQVTVNNLLKINLTGSRKNPRHKRSPLIVLNKRGRDLFAGILKDDQLMIEKWFADTLESERKQTRQTLQSLYNQILKGDTHEKI
jgi:DNA-binding MarR family transcriptional regulator